jgi:hypothetical protein
LTALETRTLKGGDQDDSNRPGDVLHPGRRLAEKLGDGGMTEAFLLERVDDYLSGRALKRLPKVVAEEQEKEKIEAEESADEA